MVKPAVAEWAGAGLKFQTTAAFAETAASSVAAAQAPAKSTIFMSRNNLKAQLALSCVRGPKTLATA